MFSSLSDEWPSRLQASRALRRATRGGILGGAQLTAVAQLVSGGSRIKGAVLQARHLQSANVLSAKASHHGFDSYHHVAWRRLTRRLVERPTNAD